MDISRGVVSQKHLELENGPNTESRYAEVSSIESNLPGEEVQAIAISIVSNSRLLSEGLLSLLSPYLNLQLIGTYSGEVRVNSLLPNPPGHVVLLDSSVGHTVAIDWIRHWHQLVPAAFVLILELASDK